MEFTVGMMENLAELLRPPEPEVLQGSDLPTTTGCDISSTRQEAPAPPPPAAPRTIEEFEEEQAREAGDLALTGGGLGDRKTPQYTMNYRQAVTAEDVFLQIGAKTPASASCEDLIVRVHLPEEQREHVELSVQRARVEVSAPRHRLLLPLPHAVDPDKSRAQWDADASTLILTLRLDREFDFVNF